MKQTVTCLNCRFSFETTALNMAACPCCKTIIDLKTFYLKEEFNTGTGDLNAGKGCGVNVPNTNT